jgi:hypothetical protein
MSDLRRYYLEHRELISRTVRGQTMTECAMIVAAVAIVVFVAYEVAARDIGNLVSKL